MKIKEFKTYDALSAGVLHGLVALVTKKPHAVICLPSGATPRLLFDMIVSYATLNPGFFENIHFVGLDEWVGFSSDDEGSCQWEIRERLIKPLKLRPDQVHQLDACAENLELECTRFEQVIDSLGAIDFMVLGLGQNGHLGLNEPGVSWDKRCLVTELSDKTKLVGQKYFPKATPLTQGITLGIAAILASREVVLMVSGAHKRDVVGKLLSAKIEERFPASALKRHENATLYLDADAAQGLEL